MAGDHTTTEPTASRGWTDHAIERAWERHGIRYAASEWRAMLLDILAAREGQPSPAILTGTDPNRPGNLIYHTPLAGVSVRAVYDPATCTVITILDRGAALIGRKREHAYSAHKLAGRRRRERRPVRDSLDAGDGE